MKRPYAAWYLAIAIVAIAPVGLRVMAWRAPKPQPVDTAQAKAGEELFQHEWTTKDPLAGGGDGLGPVFNAASCTACHHKGGVGGSGEVDDNVTNFSIRSSDGKHAREGVIHAFAVDNQKPESLSDVDSSLPAVSRLKLGDLIRVRRNSSTNNGCGPPRQETITFAPGVDISQRNTPALFGDKLIDEIPDRVIIANEKTQRVKWGLAHADDENVPVGRVSRLTNGRIGHFGWKAQIGSLSDFVQAACANELGLGNPGQAQPRPLGNPSYQTPGLDLTSEQCNQLTAFIAALSRPVERLPESGPKRDQAVAGKKRFTSIGCTDCHTPDVGAVQGLYSDLLLHRMGQDLVGGGSYGEPPPPLPDFPPGEGPSPGEWRTPPLWGVADSAPYLHDGRAATLDEAIRLHGGQAGRSARLYAGLPDSERGEVIAFLQTLRAP
jgi:CxxC motif-containing protein (DUF1111 family)